MMVDDNIEGGNDFKSELGLEKLPWYMMDKDGTVIKSWNFFITILLIYELLVNPFILAFPNTYSKRLENGSHIIETS